MSLATFIKKRLNDLHTEASAAKNTVNRTVIKPVASTASKVARTVTAPAPRPSISPLIRGAKNTLDFGSRVYDQVNTLDGNRTFKQRNATNNRSVVGQLTHNGTTNFVGDTFVKPIARIPINVSTQIYNRGVAPVLNLPKQDLKSNPLGMGSAARVTGATGSTHQTVGDLAQGALTLASGGVGRAVEAGVARVAIPLLGRVAAGATLGYGFGATTGISNGDNAKQILTRDAPIGAVMGGAAPVAVPLAKAAGKTGAKIAKKGADVATKKPFRNISDEELAAVARVNQSRTGFGDTIANVQPNDVAIYRQVQKKLGTSVNDHSGIDTLLAERNTYNTRMQARVQAIKDANQKFAPGLKTQAVDDNGNPLGLNGKPLKQKVAPHDTFVKEYADSLRQMENGLTGGNIVRHDAEVGGGGVYLKETNHTPFYRKYYAEHGRAPSKKAWMEEAKRQLESGKADQYAQEHYNSLKNPEIQSLLTQDPSYFAPDNTVGNSLVPNNIRAAAAKADAAKPKINIRDGLKQSTKDSKPTAISDALLAKKAKLEAKRAAAGGKPTETAPMPDQVPAPNGKVKQNKFTKGAKDNRQNLSEAVVSEVQGSHAVRNTKALQNEAAAKADAAGTDKTIADAYKSLQVKPGKINDKTVASTQQAIERADAAGRTEDAVKLHDELSAHLTAQGQSIQAASLFYRLSPQGQLYKAMRDIKKGGGTVSPELEAKLRTMTDDIKAMTDGDAKDFARAEFTKTVRESIPQSNLKGALSVWKAGLLSGAKTQTGNFLSNGTFAALKKTSDAPAVLFDNLISFVTGKRSKAFTMRGSASGAMQGVKSGIKTIRTGIDARDIGNGGKSDVHAELNFKNPIIQNVFGKPSNLVFRTMGAGDQPFYYATAKNNLYDMAYAEALNRDLTGKEAYKFIRNFVDNPSREVAEKAKAAAEKAVLAQDSKLAASLTRLAQEHPSIQVLAPFIKVPTNFLTRSLDYTPVGALKGVSKALRDRKAGQGFDQRAFVEAMGEATTGTALLYLGAELAGNKLLSGAYPTDPKEQARWKAEGITPNSVHIGNKWISLNYLGPLGLLLNAGKSYHDAAADGNNGYMQALASFGKNLAGQSFLSGFNSFTDALKDPERYLSSLKNSEASSLVPSWANDLANILDSKQREASTAPEAIQSRVPGLRNSLPVKTDVYGNGLDQRVSNKADLTADPLRPSTDISQKNSVVSEVNRLHTVDPKNTDLQVTPVAPKSINIEGTVVKLDSKQKYELNNKVGGEIQKKWNALIKTPEYKKSDDATKAEALSKLRSDITAAVERTYVADNKLGTYKKPPKRAVLSLMQDQTELTDYIAKTQQSEAPSVKTSKNTDTTTRKFLSTYNAMSSQQREKASNTSNDFDYKVAKAKYDSAMADKSLTTVKRIKAESALEKAKAGATYSRTVRDMYQLNSNDLSTYLTTSEKGIDKKKLADQILAYGDALVAAGVTDKNKFRTSKGVVTLGKISSKGKKTSKKAPALPKIKTSRSTRSRQTYKQVALPKMRAKTTLAKYKTARLSTNINSKLRKA